MNTLTDVKKKELYLKDPDQNDELSLKEILIKLRSWWKYLLSKWLLVLVGGLLGVFIGLLYAFKQKIIYHAELTFALEDEQSTGIGSYAGIASQFGLNVDGGGGGAFSGDNLIELMKSRALIEKALLSPVTINNKKQSLAEYYIDFNDCRKKWQKNPKLKNISIPVSVDRLSFNRIQDSLLGAFYQELIDKNLSVSKKDKKLSIVLVDVSSTNELFSKLFAEILVNQVSQFYREIKTIKSTQNLAILQRQTDSVRRVLNSAITGVASSEDVNPNPNLALQILRAPSQKRQVDVQANTAILTELVKNLEIAKVTLRRETPLIQVIDRPILPLSKTSFGKVKGMLLGGIIGGSLIVFLIILFNIGNKIRVILAQD